MENANKPAMPVKIVSAYGTKTSKGLTKREMFAMHAMQGLLSNSGGVVQANSMSGTGFCNSDEKSLAKWAVSCADALLEELL